MDHLFHDYDWSRLSIINITKVHSDKVGVFHDYSQRMNHYELGIRYSGRSLVRYDGTVREYSTGDVIYLPKEERRVTDYSSTVMEPIKGTHIIFELEKPLAPGMHIIKCNDVNLEKISLKLLNAYNRPAKSRELEIMALFYELLAGIAEIEANVAVDAGERSRLLPAVEYMEAHFCDEFIDMDMLAALVGTTKEYFRHCFTKVYGIAPLQYVNRLKANYVKSLICNYEYSIGEIARMSGFNDLNYFSRFFKKQFGISPTEYRKYYGIIV